jgi:hypothetical protein
VPSSSFIASDRNGGILLYPGGLFFSRTDDDWLATAKEQVQRSFTLEECRQFRVGEQVLGADS